MAILTSNGKFVLTGTSGRFFRATKPTPPPPVLSAGLYDANDNLLVSWEDSGIDATCSNGAIVVASYPTCTKVIIGNSVTSIGSSDFYGAFYNCSGLTSITIPDSVTSIRNHAFYNCSGLTSITIPDSVTSIGSNTFYGCSSLESITIPDSVTSIGDSMFSGCSRLTSITIPNSVTSIGYSAFSGCSGLTSVTIPEGVTSIGSGAFNNCTGLTSITIPGNVMSIGSSAFKGCLGFTSVMIPDGVTSIGKSAFEGCTGLTSITIPFVGGGKSSYSHFGYIFGASETTDNKKYVPSSLETVIITGSTTINNSVFYQCSGLTSITIPSSVTGFDRYAFYDCSGLTSIIFQGTKAQWNAITKISGWNTNTGNYRIYCTDGELPKA